MYLALLGSKNQYEREQMEQRRAKQEDELDGEQAQAPQGQGQNPYSNLRRGGRRQAGPTKTPSGRDIPPQLQGYENVAFVEDEDEGGDSNEQ